VTRKDPNLTDKLCCMILLHYGIPHDVAKDMRRSDILRLVEWDHYPVAFATARDLGWTPDDYNHPSNLQPILPDDHTIKSARRDKPAISKDVRVSDAHEEHRRRMLAKSGSEEEVERYATAPPPPSRRQWPTRPLSRPKSSKIPSRPFQKRETTK